MLQRLLCGRWSTGRLYLQARFTLRKPQVPKCEQEQGWKLSSARAEELGQ